jgi:hypothetical protein
MLVITSVIALLAVESAIADDISYTYAQVRFADVEIDDANLDGDGFIVGGSYRINEKYFAFGGYRDIDFDQSRDASALRVGGGYIYPVSERLHAVGKAYLARVKASRPGFSDSDTGFGLEVGARGRVTPKLEARGFLGYSDVGGSDTSLTLGGDYYFTPRLSAGITIDIGGDVTGLTLGGRYYFAD